MQLPGKVFRFLSGKFLPVPPRGCSAARRVQVHLGKASLDDQFIPKKDMREPEATPFLCRVPRMAAGPLALSGQWNPGPGPPSAGAPTPTQRPPGNVGLEDLRGA